MRKLALAIEGSDGLILLLTDRQAARPLPLPVAMRIELEQVTEDQLRVRVAKDRRGRVTAPALVTLPGRAAPVGAKPRPHPERLALRSA